MQQEWIDKGNRYLANTYRRFPIGIARGEGCWLWDMTGRRYLDFLSGIAVCNLGHANRAVVDAVAAQARKLIHISNLFYTEPQVRAAGLLVDYSFGDKVFFCNSGAAANEAAIKLARRYSWKHHGEGRAEIIAMENSFHGRTLATLSATGQSVFHVGFSPLVDGFRFVPFNDIGAVEKALSAKTCAVILECVQSEGGVFVANKEYLKALREMTAARDILLILDEIQTGIGRTGKLFGYEHYGIEPDIMSLAKALGSGFPVGAIVAKDRVMEAFEPGTHASTFGGNPLASAAVTATINTILEEGVVAKCAAIGSYLHEGLLRLKAKFPALIVDVRRLGLLLGIEFSTDVAPIVQYFLAEGVILYASKGNVIRLLPPLIIGKEEVDIFLELANKIFERHSAR
jgi:predicted acetylornithine/succinylornithine family transaminase